MSIRAVIVLLILILPFRGYTQTDTVYCLPIQKARLLVADAYKNRVQDSLISELSEKVKVLEEEKQNFQVNINNVILNEQAKVNDATLLADDYKKLYEVSEQEKQHLKKTAKKDKRKLTGAIILGVLLVGLAVTN